jgi:hypothetical protein
MLSGWRLTRWWGPSARSITLATFLLSTNSGCCSETLRPRPPGTRPEPLTVSDRDWVVVGETVTLPYKDLREILANRRRWVAYATSYEIVVDDGND